MLTGRMWRWVQLILRLLRSTLMWIFDLTRYSSTCIVNKYWSLFFLRYWALILSLCCYRWFTSIMFHHNWWRLISCLINGLLGIWRLLMPCSRIVLTAAWSLILIFRTSHYFFLISFILWEFRTISLRLLLRISCSFGSCLRWLTISILILLIA